MKVYKSKCILSVNVELKDGSRKHLLFSNVGKNGAYLYVRSKEVQEELEKHEWYGKDFFLYRDEEKDGSEVEQELREVVKEKKKVKKEEEPAAEQQGTGQEGGNAEIGRGEPAGDAAGTVADEESHAAEQQGAGQEETAAEPQGTGQEEVRFSCFDDARQWANEVLGVAKKKLMSKNAVVTAGEAAGYKVVIEH